MDRWEERKDIWKELCDAHKQGRVTVQCTQIPQGKKALYFACISRESKFIVFMLKNHFTYLLYRLQ